MTFKSAKFRNFRIKFEQKNIIFLSGNVYDLYLKHYVDNYDNSLNEDESVYCDIYDLIKKTCVDNLYKNIEIFTPGSGCQSFSHDSYKRPSWFISAQEDELRIDEFLDITTKQIEYFNREPNKSTPKVYVIDLSDFYFDEKTSGDLLNNVLKIFSLILEKKCKTLNDFKGIKKSNKIIFIARDDHTITRFLSQKNDELAKVIISKPDKEERLDLFSTCTNLQISNYKKITGGNTNKDQEEALALTDGFSNKEILQLFRINSLGSNVTFKELFMSAQYNKTQSEWEKISSEKINNIHEYLSSRVMGQENAIQSVKRNLINSFVGLNGVMHNENLTKPKGILFFVGPTGVGKTELAKAISEFVFGDENRMIRFDMSEFNHEHSDQRLIGAPPGYVGYDAGGELTTKIKENPFSVILFDEIEKAHGKIMDKFLQILEDGRLTSAKGELIDFSETFIIFTSNIGSSSVSYSSSAQESRNNFVKAVKKHFTEKLNRPELLNRIGEKNIVAFDFLTDQEVLKKIMKIKMSKITNALYKKHNIIIKPEAREEIALFDIIEDQYKLHIENGGRGLLNCIENIFIDKINQYILSNFDHIKKAKKEDKIIEMKYIVKNDTVVFELSQQTD